MLDLPDPSSRAAFGVGARHKRRGPHDMFIVPLGELLMQLPTTDDAVLFLDRNTPYRLMAEVVFTISRQRAQRIVVATAPHTWGSSRAEGFELDRSQAPSGLVAFLVDEGVTLKNPWF